MAVPPPHPETITKAALRKALRARRRALPRDPAAAAALAERVIERLGQAATIAAYVADDGEVDPLPILAWAHDHGIATALPHLAGGHMRFLAWAPGDSLEAGPFGLRQPAADAPEHCPDLILSPLVGFDRSLRRLGRGGGFYDRIFAALPAAQRIGLAWSIQEVSEVPVDPWDVPLHGIATETEWIS